jgi:DNA modification methylase
MKPEPFTSSALPCEAWPLARPRPYDKNARKLSPKAVEKLAASIKAFGFRQPIVVDEKDVIIAGHTRLMAAQKLGLETVPVHVATGLTPAQVRAYRLADNRTAAETTWDEEILEAELAELKALDEIALSETAFDDEELEEYLATEPEGDEDAVPDAPVTPVSRTGDLWLLGSHRVLCGDSTDAATVARLMDGAKADMVFTDPPYGIDYQDLKKNHTKIAGDESLANIDSLLRATLANACPMFLCCNWKCYSVFEAAMIKAGRNPKACIVWDKKTGTQNLDRFYKQHEFILYFGPFGGQKTLAGDVWQCNREVRADHPTAKPVELIERAIEYVSSPKQIVLDLFGGSGSTLIACEKTQRRARLMELDPKYVDVIVARWQAFTGLEAVLDGDGRSFAELKAERLGAAALPEAA